MLEPWATDWEEAEIAGDLWDTGAGWPAARFAAPHLDGTIPDAPGPGASSVPGWWVRFEAHALGRVIEDLDAMEGIGTPPDPLVDPYVRVEIVVPAVGTAWAYHATRISPGWRRIDRWTDQPEA